MTQRYSNNINNYYWNHQDLLGQGGFGKVFKGVDMNKKGTQEEQCAIKLMDFKQMKSNPILVELFKNESKALLTLKGDHVMNARDIIEKSPYIYVIGPLCNGGDLRKLLNKRGGQPLSEDIAQPMFRQMLMGMKQLVDNNLVHRDLKPENTFIHNGIYKIADFGFCQTVKEGETMDFSGGTPGYMNPQIVLNQTYTNKCDVWTMAIIYYEMLFGNIPGRGNEDEDRIRDIKRNGIQFPSNINVSKESKLFLKNCLYVEENRRWNWQQVFASDVYIRDFKNSDIPQTKRSDLQKGDIEFIKSLKEYIVSQGDNVQATLGQFFPNSQFNEQQFIKFCSYSKISQENINRIFKYLDKDGSGTVNVQEFNDQIMEQDFSEPEISPILIQQRFKAIVKNLKAYCLKRSVSVQQLYFTVNGNKPEMDLNIFSKILKNMDRDITQHEIEILYKTLDTDKSGHISATEFVHAFSNGENISEVDISPSKAQNITEGGMRVLQRLKTIIRQNNLDIDQIFMHFNINKNANLSIEEFRQMILDLDRYSDAKSIDELFLSIAGQDKQVDIQEFQNIFK